MTMEFNSEEHPSVSGEIGSSPDRSGLEHLEKKEHEPASSTEKLESRKTKYRELIAKKTAELAAMDDAYVKGRGQAAYERELANGKDADMAMRVREATEKGLKERAEDLTKLVAEMTDNLHRLESGQDDLYASN